MWQLYFAPCPMLHFICLIKKELDYGIRFEDREENRKDCLRTLLSLIEEAGKANKIVEDARTAYAKQRLKANPKFMARLHAKTAKMRESTTPLPE